MPAFLAPLIAGGARLLAMGGGARAIAGRVAGNVAINAGVRKVMGTGGKTDGRQMSPNPRFRGGSTINSPNYLLNKNMNDMGGQQ